MSLKDIYTVRPISFSLAKEYIHLHHYTHGSHNGASVCCGLYEQDRLWGVCMFATPCSENVRSSIFGPDYKDTVTELHRLHVLDGTPKNTESFFIARCLKMLKQVKPHLLAVIAFSDPTEGHQGTIYQATNAIYYGQTSTRTFYQDETGRLRHPRQNGHNIRIQEALERGWTLQKRLGKYRYLWLLAKKHPKILVKSLSYP